MKPFPTLLCALCALCGFKSNATERPNVLLIVSDDQGYADAGFQGGRQAVTPHLDAMPADKNTTA